MTRALANNSLARSGNRGMRHHWNYPFYLYNRSLESLTGLHAREDAHKSFMLNSQAAESGMRDAVLAMGWFYLNGVGVEQILSKLDVGTGSRRGKATPERCLASDKWLMTTGTLRMPRSGSGEQATRGMLGHCSGLASCTGEAMEYPRTENKRWCFSRRPQPIKFQRHGAC